LLQAAKPRALTELASGGDALRDDLAALARARRENFPVALRLLPDAKRRHLIAIYGFARLADDISDEASGDRLALLDALDRELDRALVGNARHPTLRRLAATIEAIALPEAPLRKLVEAGRRDQRVHRYATWEELRDYCALSADPVGELVLHVFGAASPERLARSESACTGLQLVEHCQDVAEDLGRGRVYLPAEDLARHGCSVDELGRAAATPALRRVVAFEVERARWLLADGERLVASLRGSARLAVAGFVAGGRAACDAIARVGFDVLAHPAPGPRRRDVVRHAFDLLLAAPRRERSR
jgi:squalene synthase HpnC